MRVGVLSAWAATKRRRLGARLAPRAVSGALAAVLLALLATLGATPALAAPAAATAAPSANRPTEAVAYARVAVVRVLSYYYGRTANSGPIPVLSPCIGDGALIGTTGDNLNSYSYALIPTALVNPISPCQASRRRLSSSMGRQPTGGCSAFRWT